MQISLSSWQPLAKNSKEDGVAIILRRNSECTILVSIVLGVKGRLTSALRARPTYSPAKYANPPRSILGVAIHIVDLVLSLS